MWVVICTMYEDELPLQQVVYGPFATMADAGMFVNENRSAWETVRLAPLIKPPENPQIHPNQAQIGDYIDPSVAN